MMLVRNSVGGKEVRDPHVVYQWISALVNLILTKRKARYERTKTAKRSANQFQKYISMYVCRTLVYPGLW